MRCHGTYAQRNIAVVTSQSCHLSLLLLLINHTKHYRSTTHTQQMFNQFSHHSIVGSVHYAYKHRRQTEHTKRRRRDIEMHISFLFETLSYTMPVACLNREAGMRASGYNTLTVLNDTHFNWVPSRVVECAQCIAYTLYALCCLVRGMCIMIASSRDAN